MENTFPADQQAPADHELNLSQKKDYAKELFLKSDLTQKQIAAKVGISENSITAWKLEGQWEKQKKSLLQTRSEILAKHYDLLAMLTDEAHGAIRDGDPETKPNADAISKITKVIKSLETETGVGEIISVGRAFINFVLPESNEEAKIIAKWFDLFIKQQLTAK